MSKLSLVGAMIMLLKEKPPDVRPSGCWVINSKPDPVVELFFGRDRFHRPADCSAGVLDLPRRLVLQAATVIAANLASQVNSGLIFWPNFVPAMAALWRALRRRSKCSFFNIALLASL